MQIGGAIPGAQFVDPSVLARIGNLELVARSVARPRSLHAAEARPTDARAEVTARVETPAVESARLEPVKSEAKVEQGAPELRRSTD